MNPQNTPPRSFVQNGIEYRPVFRRGNALEGYWVGENGQLLSQWRLDRGIDGRIRWSIGESYTILSPSPCGKRMSYRGVSFRANGRTIRASVHAIVAEAFFGPCPTGLEVCHGDGNGHNNRLENLRYGTKSENMADRDRHVTHQRGQQNPSAKLTDDQAEQIRRLRASGMKLKEIAVRFDVQESTVSRIANRVRRGR